MTERTLTSLFDSHGHPETASHCRERFAVAAPCESSRPTQTAEHGAYSSAHYRARGKKLVPRPFPFMSVTLRRMKALRLLLVLLVLAFVAPGAGADAPPKLLRWSELSVMPLPTPAKRIAYGSTPQQFGELRLPTGSGPFPVVVLVHGGCWMAEFDYVAKTEPLDLQRVYAAGHSAGGQLALWLATRARLAKDSQLYRSDPLPIHGVLGLAAVTDLHAYRKGPPDSCHGSVDQVMGGSPEEYPRRYAETSPRQLLPLGVPQVFIQGDDDPIVAPAPVRAYVEAARKAGDHAEYLTLSNAGHFEASVPLPQTEAAFEQALHWLWPAGDNAH